MGINDSYKIIRGQILMMKPLPSLSITYSLIIQEERQGNINIPLSLSSDAIAMHVSTNQKKSLTSSHCKKFVYTKSQCYRLNGFLSNFKFTKNKKEESKSSSQQVTSLSSLSITLEQYQKLLQLFNYTTF